jgi:hypothetical protein
MRIKRVGTFLVKVVGDFVYAKDLKRGKDIREKRLYTENFGRKRHLVRRIP